MTDSHQIRVNQVCLVGVELQEDTFLGFEELHFLNQGTSWIKMAGMTKLCQVQPINIVLI